MSDRYPYVDPTVEIEDVNLVHIDPSAKIGKGTKIHKFAMIGKNVEIGENCEIYPFASILTGARIGNRVKIYNGCVISAEPQDFRWNGEASYCVIEDDCAVRELSIINRGISPDGGTRIGTRTFIMAESHIAHDTQIEGNSVLGNGTSVAPYCKIGAYTILSSNVVLHANSHLGRWSMIKGGCRISGNVPPFVIIAHNPMTYYGVNAIVLRHLKFSEETIDDIAKAYRHVYQCGTSTFNALKRIESDVRPSDARTEIINFIREHNLKIVAVRSHEDVVD